MLTPSNRTITIASGGTALVGRTTAIGVGGAATPAWAAGAVLNKAVFIPNTAGLGGAPGAYSGWTWKGTTIILGLASGHAAGFDNRVVTIDVMQDAPAWVTRTAPSTSTSADTPYYPDGKPAGRHLYQMAHYIAAIDAVVFGGVRFTHPNAGQFFNSDAYDMSTYSWKAAGYLPNIPTFNGAGVIDYDGIYQAGLFSVKFNPSTLQWDASGVTVASGYSDYAATRHPWATDKIGRKVFGISIGDGEGAGTDLRVHVMRNNVIYKVTIAPSSALTQFVNDRPAGAGMDFDPVNGCFIYLDLFHNRFYKFVVADDNTATVSLWIPDLSAAPLPTAGTANLALNPRLTYVPALGGIVYGPVETNLAFIKTT